MTKHSLNITLEKSCSESLSLGGGGLSDNSSTENDLFDGVSDWEEFLYDATDLDNSNTEDDEHSSTCSDECSIFKDVDSVDGDTTNNSPSPFNFFKKKSETQFDKEIRKNISEYSSSHGNFNSRPFLRTIPSPVSITQVLEEDVEVSVQQAGSLAFTFSDVFNHW